MEETKVCPECGAEYYAHVDACKGCEVALVAPSEFKGPGVASAKLKKAEADLICVIQGAYDKVQDVAREIKAAEIDCRVLNISGASSCGAGVFGLFVHKDAVRHAARVFESYMARLNSGLGEAEEKLASGVCPACGADIRQAKGECPDCGLNIGGGHEDHDDGCGSGGCGTC